MGPQLGPQQWRPENELLHKRGSGWERSEVRPRQARDVVHSALCTAFLTPTHKACLLPRHFRTQLMLRSLIASSLGAMSWKALFPTPIDTISAKRISE